MCYRYLYNSFYRDVHLYNVQCRPTYYRNGLYCMVGLRFKYCYVLIIWVLVSIRHCQNITNWINRFKLFSVSVSSRKSSSIKYIYTINYQVQVGGLSRIHQANATYASILLIRYITYYRLQNFHYILHRFDTKYFIFYNALRRVGCSGLFHHLFAVIQWFGERDPGLFVELFPRIPIT